LVAIQKARIEKGLTQEELGVKVGTLNLIFQKLRTMSNGHLNCPGILEKPARREVVKNLFVQVEKGSIYLNVEKANEFA
jgi:transcriptional regulator with XRE-family HTH domain